MKILSLLLVLLFAVEASAADFRYDKWFKRSTAIHFGTRVRPEWLKAVAMAESALKYNAKSYVGALGLMQFMPGTWTDVAPEPYKSMGAINPEAAIYVGGLYLRQIWNKYPQATTYNRKAFSNAGYNSGPGNINKARNKCAVTLKCNKEIWDAPNVESNLVTKPQFQKETKDYVARIRRFEIQLITTGGLQ